MSIGKSVKIYLTDGTSVGIRHAELVNWTGQAIACPRNRVGELVEWEEALRPGVYFLFGYSETDGQPMVYIGEAQNVFTRLQQHLSGKEFWNEVVFFTNKDENLTSSHVRYLESKFVKAAIQAARYQIENGNEPQPSPLPPADRDAMEEFMQYTRILLGVLGHRTLEPLLAPPVTSQELVAPSVHLVSSSKTTALFLAVGGLEAKGVQTDEGIVLLAGSQASIEPYDSLSPGNREVRQMLIDKGVLKLEGQHFVFTSDYLFNSPSAAACVVVGYSINGRQHWKDKDGRSIKQLEEEIAV